MEGVIEKLVADKGYGFIKVEGREKGLFFHSNDVTGGGFDSLKEGDKVTFEIGQSDKGDHGINVAVALVEAA